jgi:hypothetical protein
MLSDGVVFNSYATGAVSVDGFAYADGDFLAGGLVGLNDFGNIDKSYATGNLSRSGYSEENLEMGGLVGRNYGGINQSYATGRLTDSADGLLGGLVGFNYGSVNSSFWDMDTTGQNNAIGYDNGANKVGGLVGLSTQAFLNENNFTSATTDNGNTNAEWDFTLGSGTWFMIEGETRPFLQSEYSTTISNSHQLQLMAMDLNANYTLANNINMSAEFKITDVSRAALDNLKSNLAS